MPRRPLTLNNRLAYHVTSRSNNQDWFYLPIQQCWYVFQASLNAIVEKYQVHAYSFVLMSNHFHLILSTPFANLGDVMRDFLTFTSKRIQSKVNRKNHVFGARYKWSLLDSEHAVGYVTKYLLRNPVRAGVCNRVEEYLYSSLNRQGLPLVCGFDPYWRAVPRGRESLLNWLNQPTAKELEMLIAQGLRREVFAFSKDNGKQRLVRALQSVYGIE